MQITTPRLTIRAFSSADIPAYAGVVADPEVMRYLGGAPRSAAQARAYVIDCIERHRASGISRYAVARRADDLFLGYCGFKALTDDTSGNVPPGTPWVDFGWQYRRSAWRQGFGTEAAHAVYRYRVDVLRLSNMEIRTHQRNLAALKIIAGLGFVWLNDYDSPAGRFRRFGEPPR